MHGHSLGYLYPEVLLGVMADGPPPPVLGLTLSSLLLFSYDKRGWAPRSGVSLLMHACAFRWLCLLLHPGADTRDLCTTARHVSHPQHHVLAQDLSTQPDIRKKKKKKRNGRFQWLIGALLVQRINLPFHRAVRKKKSAWCSNEWSHASQKLTGRAKKQSSVSQSRSRSHIQRRKAWRYVSLIINNTLKCLSFQELFHLMFCYSMQVYVYMYLCK